MAYDLRLEDLSTIFKNLEEVRSDSRERGHGATCGNASGKNNGF